MYSDVQMDKLANVLGQIIDGGEGSWHERRDAVIRAMRERDATVNLEEFIGWFDGMEIE